MRQRTPVVERRVLDRAGSPVQAYLHGPRHGPTVVLTHGLSLDHRAFDAQVPDLVAAGYRVITWDVRGHGASQPMGDGITIEQAAADLGAVLDEFATEPVVLLGQSFGGMIVQEFATRYPDRVAGLVVIGAPALGDRPGMVLRVLQRLRIRMIKLWPDGLLRRVFSAMVTRDPAVRAYVTTATRQLPKSAFVAASAAAMDGHLRAEGAPVPGIPVLLLHGEREERPVARAMARWEQREPTARRVVVPGGHLVNQENPEGANRVLLRFLEAHLPAPQDR